MRRSLRLTTLVALALIAGGAARREPARLAAVERDGARRISFRVRTLLGPEGARSIVSDATVEGALGTDLTLRSQAGSFTLAAQIKTDLLSNGTLRLVADLTTRRSAGRSERGLPLFEEDVQRQIVKLATDGSQSLVVLPFGRNPGGEELALDILPQLTGHPARDRTGQWLPPAIQIAQVGPEGWLNIEAAWNPHRFRVEGVLRREGRSLARGAGHCALAEVCALPLTGFAGAPGALNSRLDLTVIRTLSTCPTPQVAFEFDLLGGASGPPPTQQAIDATGAAPRAKSASPSRRASSGIGLAGIPLAYPLEGLGASLPGQPDTLTLTITPEDLP